MSTRVTGRVRWLSPAEERAWRGYRRMRTILDLNLSRDLARESGLSDPDYDVLSTLSDREDCQWRAGDLAVRLLWSSSRLTHHIKRMETRGLVSRLSCVDDGRGAVLALTDLGLTTLNAAAPLHLSSVREHLVDLLTPEEIECLAAISEKVISRHADGPAM